MEIRELLESAEQQAEELGRVIEEIEDRDEGDKEILRRVKSVVKKRRTYVEYVHDVKTFLLEQLLITVGRISSMGQRMKLGDHNIYFNWNGTKIRVIRGETYSEPFMPYEFVSDDEMGEFYWELIDSLWKIIETDLQSEAPKKAHVDLQKYREVVERHNDILQTGT